MTTTTIPAPASKASRMADRKAARAAEAAKHFHPADCNCGPCHLFRGPIAGCSLGSEGHECSDCAHARLCNEHPEVVDARLFGRSVPAATITAAEAVARDGLAPEHGDGTGSGARPVDGPSDKQVAFIAKLAAEKNVEVPVCRTKRDASKAIERLLALPTPQRIDGPIEGRWTKVDGLWLVKLPVGYGQEGKQIVIRKSDGSTVEAILGVDYDARGGEVLWHIEQKVEAASVRVCGAPANLPDVPEGHFALPSTGDNDLVFYRVDRPTEGQWAGRMFVKMVVGGHADQRVPASHISGILARIVEFGVEESQRLYGREIGRCCVCNRHLTSDWRKQGIGPECVKKVQGW